MGKLYGGAGLFRFQCHFQCMRSRNYELVYSDWKISVSFETSNGYQNFEINFPSILHYLPSVRLPMWVVKFLEILQHLEQCIHLCIRVCASAALTSALLINSVAF